MITADQIRDAQLTAYEEVAQMMYRLADAYDLEIHEEMTGQWRLLNDGELIVEAQVQTP